MAVIFKLGSFSVMSAKLDSSVLEVPEGPTNWEDEAAMRARIANYTAEKFSHDYHNWGLIEDEGKNSASTMARRKKRDGGLVSGPIATAVVTGMIGECVDDGSNGFGANELPSVAVRRRLYLVWYGPTV
ncbi:hypothetical protein ANCDUO_08072 [Ancylostoma duodenale]|uniref:Uncharacterized protein n=1 Tax=Ancylostoma duodenale TaxID=51022 RepID=A0A0C2DGS3_9BILA|nr:hypothetical protein ANCDUO_08072 [Ancylostoma duodenale]